LEYTLVISFRTSYDPRFSFYPYGLRTFFFAFNDFNYVLEMHLGYFSRIHGFQLIIEIRWLSRIDKFAVMHMNPFNYEYIFI
jgi:hypothetical protein